MSTTTATMKMMMMMLLLLAAREPFSIGKDDEALINAVVAAEERGNRDQGLKKLERSALAVSPGLDQLSEFSGADRNLELYRAAAPPRGFDGCVKCCERDGSVRDSEEDVRVLVPKLGFHAGRIRPCNAISARSRSGLEAELVESKSSCGCGGCEKRSECGGIGDDRGEKVGVLRSKLGSSGKKTGAWVARRTRLKVVALDEGDPNSNAAGKAGFERPGCANCEGRRNKWDGDEAGEVVEVLRSKMGDLAGDCEGPSARAEEARVIGLDKEEESYCSITDGDIKATDLADCCVAQRTVAREGINNNDMEAGLGSPEPIVSNTVSIGLDEKHSSSADMIPSTTATTTTTTATTVSGSASDALAGEEESSCCGNSGRKGEIIGTSLKRMKFSGLSILVPMDSDKGNSDGFDTEGIGVAKSTCSHCHR